MADVRFSKVCKTFGSSVAVDDLNLAISSGSFVSLLGPSGCGKTTTLRMLAGLEFPTSGEIRIGERVVNDVPPGKRDIAMVFQSYALYPHMTVAENIAYPLRKRRVERAARDAKVAQVAATLQLDKLMDRRPAQLSGGQQQRVALGRALVRDPHVFLLDEPLSNLDAKLRAHMRAELIELHKTVGKTFIYVTHDQLEAMTMSDRIAVMHEGRLQQFDTPTDIYNRPANIFVAGFIGTPSMNFIRGGLVREAGKIRFSHKALAASVTLRGEPSASSEVILGIRPEDISVGRGPLIARVRILEPTGHETIVVLDLADASLVARVAPDLALRAGETAPIELRALRLHLFDGETDRRMNAVVDGAWAADA